ncbi:DUF1275 family protein [Dactylosporangium matsuzakiense]|nr:DUF1275 family protein [Dactylosporangium matsuzakiense]UWZ48979.1 DUF1275 family protein [Dactylosporangium matsuzakiense]
MRRTMLALAAGYLDGLALLYLGGAFASVVGGNLVLAGVAAVADRAHLAGAVLATGVYAATVVAARRVAPARCGVAALAALCALTGGWAAAHHDPRGVVQMPLLALASIACGLLAPRRMDWRPLLAVPVGAAGAVLLLDRAAWLGPLPAVALVAVAVVVPAGPEAGWTPYSDGNGDGAHRRTRPASTP